MLDIGQQARGCLWSPVADPLVPWCYFPQDWGYRVTNITRYFTRNNSPRYHELVLHYHQDPGYHQGHPP